MPLACAISAPKLTFISSVQLSGLHSPERRNALAVRLTADPVELANLDRMLAVDASRLETAGRAPAEPIDPNTHFQRQLAKSPVPTSIATRIADWHFLVLQGKFIDAVAETAMNSDPSGPGASAREL